MTLDVKRRHRNENDFVSVSVKCFSRFSRLLLLSAFNTSTSFDDDVDDDDNDDYDDVLFKLSLSRQSHDFCLPRLMRECKHLLSPFSRQRLLDSL